MHIDLFLFYGFRNDLFQQEGFGTLNTLRFAFVGNDQQPAAFGTWHSERFLPRSKVAVGIIDTAKEGAAFACFSFNKVAAIGWAGNTDLQQPRLCITTIREAAARNEFTEAPVADDQFLAASRAGTSDRFGTRFGDRHFGLRF
mgnify:FL=1